MEDRRPDLSIEQNNEVILNFISRWQQAVDQGSADLFNDLFSADILWGSPFGALVRGYDEIHSIHERMFSLMKPTKGRVTYELEESRFLSEKIAIAFVRRVHQELKPNHDAASKPFNEVALLVLVESGGKWWLAAAQHVPDRRDVYRNNGKQNDKVF